MSNQPYECFDWRAWQQEDEWGQSVLRVCGKCRILKAGYSVEIKRLAPQGISPRVRILVVLAHKPFWPGRSLEPAVREIDYTEIAGTVFDSVLIMPEGTAVKVLTSRSIQ